MIVRGHSSSGAMVWWSYGYDANARENTTISKLFPFSNVHYVLYLFSVNRMKTYNDEKVLNA